MLIDRFNRKIDYLRVSVTSRCNFRCLYCMPNTPFEWEPKENLLTYEEMFQFLKVAIDSGIKKIRLTGGEPLIRKDLDKFIKMISDYAPNIDLALTTNGYYLENSAKLLKEAGLKRVNISLDSLKKETYQKIAQKDVLDKVLKGIEESIKVGLKVKLNVVILKGFDLIYEISSNNLFKLSGYFLVTGAVLNLFFIGLLVWIIGWVLVMIGFFTLYENTDIIEAEIIEEKKLLEKN